MSKQLTEILKVIGAGAGVVFVKILVSSPAVTAMGMFMIAIIYQISYWITPDNWKYIFFTAVPYSLVASILSYKEVKETLKIKTA